MLTVRVRWTLLLVIAFLGLAPSQHAEGGEFLKRLFGRKCRQVCSPCPAEVSVCYGTPVILRDISVCPIQEIASVDSYNGQEFKCAYKIFFGTVCGQNNCIIQVPCEVKPKKCISRKCCEVDNPNNCRSTQVTVSPAVTAIATPIVIGGSHEQWDPMKIPGAKDTYNEANVTNGFSRPMSGGSGEATVKVNCAQNILQGTYKAMKNGKYYELNRLEITIGGQKYQLGVGYEITKVHFDAAIVDDISNYLHGDATLSKAYNFGESRNAKWAWNYNVVEFK